MRLKYWLARLDIQNPTTQIPTLLLRDSAIVYGWLGHFPHRSRKKSCTLEAFLSKKWRDTFLLFVRGWSFLAQSSRAMQGIITFEKKVTTRTTWKSLDPYCRYVQYLLYFSSQKISIQHSSTALFFYFRNGKGRFVNELTSRNHQTEGWQHEASVHWKTRVKMISLNAILDKTLGQHNIMPTPPARSARYSTYSTYSNTYVGLVCMSDIKTFMSTPTRSASRHAQVRTVRTVIRM